MKLKITVRVPDETDRSPFDNENRLPERATAARQPREASSADKIYSPGSGSRGYQNELGVAPQVSLPPTDDLPLAELFDPLPPPIHHLPPLNSQSEYPDANDNQICFMNQSMECRISTDQPRPRSALSADTLGRTEISRSSARSEEGFPRCSIDPEMETRLSYGQFCDYCPNYDQNSPAYSGIRDAAGGNYSPDTSRHFHQGEPQVSRGNSQPGHGFGLAFQHPSHREQRCYRIQDAFESGHNVGETSCPHPNRGGRRSRERHGRRNFQESHRDSEAYAHGDFAPSGRPGTSNERNLDSLNDYCEGIDPDDVEAARDRFHSILDSILKRTTERTAVEGRARDSIPRTEMTASDHVIVVSSSSPPPQPTAQAHPPSNSRDMGNAESEMGGVRTDHYTGSSNVDDANERDSISSQSSDQSFDKAMREAKKTIYPPGHLGYRGKS